ncbi:hypothetical protein HF086_006743 [Spodoptera exigua]|uniref:Apyrase n=1 Tax=Spodoptera exigua TaxID=7107 RepID=A0A922M6Q0_SPOEX|nr:hypothetical protein HF086_006743 [Spodoptera exigua]
MQVVILLVVLACSAAANEDLYELNIIHYNDFHAHFDEISPSGGVCQPDVEPCIGGFARLYTAIQQARQVEPDSLLLNGGDTFQGTIWYNFLRWNVSQHFMNMLPHDAHFDHGVEGLVPYLEHLNAPMLGANVNTEWLAERVSPTVDIIVGGHSHTLLYTGPTPNGDTALGEYPTVVQQANGHRMIPHAQGSNWNNAHVCLINTGGLRTHIIAGNVTTEALLMAMPFENYVQVYELQGKYLQEALEFSVGVNWSDSFSSGRMLQIGDCDVPRYLPLDPNATYRVLSQNYIGDGGGGYTMISENRKNLQTWEIDYVMLQRYMRRQGVVTKDVDGRIQIDYDD